jgi:hypothetical protein
VPDAAAGVHVVDDLTDVTAVAEVAGRLIQEDGPFTHVIALSEFLLDTAAELRHRFQIDGPGPDLVNRFRDKTIMKDVLAASGVRVPRWSAGRSSAQLIAAAQQLGFPVILKPTRGASSQGVRKAGSAAELAALCQGLDLTGYEVEEFVAGDVLHTDGVVDKDGECRFMVTSRYVGNCLAFEQGEPLGSVIQTGETRVKECHEFARGCLAALGLRQSAFHLEYFDAGTELVFLEIGARVPGADVPYVVCDVTGVNLFRLWMDVLLGNPLSPPLEWPAGNGDSGGWLMIPRPRPLPRRVLSATPLTGRVPFLYRELVPGAGDVLVDRPGSYATLQGGRFLFRGGTDDEIWDAVMKARAAYRLSTEPVA